MVLYDDGDIFGLLRNKQRYSFHDLVPLFNGISTYVGYLKPELSL